MSNDVDFLSFLNHDLLLKILTCLEDPSDLVRFSAVSRFWQHFAITNGLCKHLCLRMFPQLSRVDHVNELGDAAKEHDEAGSSNLMEWEALKREHRVYSFFARRCLSSAIGNCISEAIMASSTDHNPEESIDNTLEPRDWVALRASYWSSKGQSNPAVPEMLTYKLVTDLCVITEIKIRPFQGPPWTIVWMNHVQILVMTSLYGLTLHKSFQWLRNIVCRISRFQNLFFALVEYYRLSFWIGSRERNWMAYSIYGTVSNGRLLLPTLRLCVSCSSYGTHIVCCFCLQMRVRHSERRRRGIRILMGYQ